MSEPQTWNFRLYVAGQSPKSIAALKNLKKLCETDFPGQHDIEVIDLTLYPEQAKADGILVIPTLVKRLPEPVRRVVGDLSQTEKVRMVLEII